MLWEILSSEYIFQSPWITLRKDQVKMPSGVVIPDFYVSEMPDWVNVIAVTKEGKYLVEEQYRHGIGKVCFELCAGIVEDGEDILSSAKRELLEETGYVSDEWIPFGCYAPNTSGSNNSCYAFIALNIQKVSEPIFDQTEDIRLHLLNEIQLKEIMLDGRMTEAVMLAPLWRYIVNK